MWFLSSAFPSILCHLEGLCFRLCIFMSRHVRLVGRWCPITSVGVSFTFITRNKINCAVKYSLGICSMFCLTWKQAMLKTVNDSHRHLRQVFVCCYDGEILISHICGKGFASTPFCENLCMSHVIRNFDDVPFLSKKKLKLFVCTDYFANSWENGYLQSINIIVFIRFFFFLIWVKRFLCYR